MSIHWTPTPVQALALECPAEELLFGGATGGGKSEFLLMDSLRYVDVPGYSAILFRRTFPELEKSLITKSHEYIPNMPGAKAKWDGLNHRWVWPNRAMLRFGHMKSKGDEMKHQSAEYNYIGFDELTHFEIQMYLFMFSRRRTNKKKNIPSFMRAATNPGGIGHQWVKNRFIDSDICGKIKFFRRIKDRDRLVDGSDVKSISRCFIPAKLDDNPHIDDNYRAALNQLPEVFRKAFQDGDWNVLEGQFFKEFDCSKHIIEPFKVPSAWPRYMAIDWGYSDPTCALWIAVSPQGIHYVYREYYFSQIIAPDVAKTLLEWCGEENIRTAYLDPHAWNKGKDGLSAGTDFVTAGLPVVPANNDRVNGWLSVRKLLQTNESDVPTLQIFSNCVDLIRTLPALVHDHRNPEDVGLNQEDHAPDALRYYSITTFAEYLENKNEGEDEVVDPTKLRVRATEDSEIILDMETGYLN